LLATAPQSSLVSIVFLSSSMQRLSRTVSLLSIAMY